MFARRLLLDGDGGREPLDAVHVGLVHEPGEPVGAGREGSKELSIQNDGR